MSFLIDLYRRAVQLCLFRVGPAEMPAGQTIMLWSTLVYFITSIFTAQLAVDGLVASIALAVVETVFFITLVIGVLAIWRKRERTVKTITAMTSSGTVMGVVGFPLLMQVPKDITAEISTGISFMLLVFVLWSLMIMAHVFRHAMDIKPGLAAVVSVAVLVAMMIVDGLLIAAMA